MVKPIMSVEEARGILGDDAKSMTDEQVAELVSNVDELAKLALDVAKEQRLKNDR
jgi:hypothetical protein